MQPTDILTAGKFKIQKCIILKAFQRKLARFIGYKIIVLYVSMADVSENSRSSHGFASKKTPSGDRSS